MESSLPVPKPRQVSVPPREWLLAIVVTLLYVLLLALPYWLGYRFAAPGKVFTGLLMNPEDSQTYFAKMWQGYYGAWLYTIPFTPEPHQPAFVGVFYVWLGQLAQALGLTVTAVWHGSRVLAQITLSLATFWFVGQYTTGKTLRWTAYLLALFGSGLGWLLFILNQPYWLDAFPVDFKQPGAHLLFTALTYPHIILGTVLILFSVWGIARLAERPSWTLAIILGFSHVALGIAYPFLIYLVALIAGLLYVEKWRIAIIRQGRSESGNGDSASLPNSIGTTARTLPIAALLPFTQLASLTWQFAVAFLIPLPMYLYYAYTLRANDVFRAWDVQAYTPSAPWPHYLLAFGPLLLFAALYAWRRPANRPSTAVLWIWVLAVGLLLYAPLNPQRRFIQGVHVPLAILAAAGFVTVLLPRIARSRIWQKLLANPRYTTSGLNRLLIAVFLLFMSLSNGYLLASVSLSAVVQQPDPLFRPIDEWTTVSWLRDHVPKTAVFLADYQSGNYIAGQAGQRVMLGHWAETVDYEGKTAVVAEFFRASTSDERRLAIFQTYGITHLWHGPRERELGSFAPETAVYLHPIFQTETITLYEFVPPTN